MNAPREALIGIVPEQARSNLEAVFEAHYEQVARLIARVTRDPGRAEELAVEVFLKWSRTPSAHGERAAGWLHRAAARVGIDELRRQSRRSRYEGVFPFLGKAPSPEELHSASQERERVRTVLAALDRREATLLLLRSDGLSYAEVAAALDLNPASVGTLVSRAQQAFRKEYVKRYGEA